MLRESKRIIRQIGPVLITETHHGFCCANSGVDQSSSGAAGRILVLPKDPDASCRAHRARFAELGVDVAVIMSDTFGRPWREGQTDVAIGISGMNPLLSYIGEVDPHGHEFHVQELCIADELAAAGELVKGNTSLAATRMRKNQRSGSATTTLRWRPCFVTAKRICSVRCRLRFVRLRSRASAEKVFGDAVEVFG